MVARIVTGDIVKVRALCYMTTSAVIQTGINVRHYVCVTHTGSGALLSEFATQLGTALAAVYKPAITTVSFWRGVGCQIISPAANVSNEEANTTTGGAGQGGVSPLPQQTAGLLRLRTDKGGRANRGFLYVPFPAEEDSDVGVPNTNYLGRLAGIASAWAFTRIPGVTGNTSNLDPIIFHKKTQSGTIVTDIAARTVWSQQKRRSAIRRSDVVPF